MAPTAKHKDAHGRIYSQGAHLASCLLGIARSRSFALISMWAVIVLIASLLFYYYGTAYSMALLVIICCLAGMVVAEVLDNLYQKARQEVILMWCPNFDPSFRDILAMAADIVGSWLKNRSKKATKKIVAMLRLRNRRE